MKYKIFKIIKSRFKKAKDTEQGLLWEYRRNVCKTCSFNTKNTEIVPLRIKLIKILSDLYTFIAGKKDEEEDLGECNSCGCPVYYKTMADYKEECPKNKWKK